MNGQATTRLLVVLLSVASIGIGWRLVNLARADVLADTDPQMALEFVPTHPDALASLANHQIASGQAGMALLTARRLLEREPLDGRGYAVAALATARMGGADAFPLHDIAARRAPRELQVRAWLVETLISDQRFAEALGHIEAILRLSPRHAEVLLPRLVALASEPAFADALAAELMGGPWWRPALMADLLSAVDTTAADMTLQALERRRAMLEGERRQWIGAMLARGRWGMAYAVESHASGGEDDADVQSYISALGSGALPAAGTSGFGWQRPDRTGVQMHIPEPKAGEPHPALHLSFPGLPPGHVLLRHPLLLPPGDYRLGMRIRTAALRDERRLAWTVTCDGGGVLAATPPLAGTRDWHAVRVELEVPASGCDRQWLQLRHDDPAGLRSVSGELWVSAMELTGALPDLAARGTPPSAVTLVPERGVAWIGGKRGYEHVRSARPLSVGEQVVLPADVVVGISADDACARRYHGPGAFRVGSGCSMRPIDPAADPGSGGSITAEGGRGIADAIIGAIDPRGQIPAGR